MTKQERNTKLSVAEAVAGDRDLIKALMKEALQEVFEGEMTEFLGVSEGTELAGGVHDVGAGLQEQVVGVGQHRLRAQLGHRFGQHRLHRRLGADRDERRRPDLPVRCRSHPIGPCHWPAPHPV